MSAWVPADQNGEGKMRRVSFMALAVLFLAGLWVLPAARAETIAAVFPTWEPYGYVKDGKPVGFEIETFAAVAGRMGYGVEFIHQPWKRCLHSMEHGLADVVISALRVADRTAYMNYPDEPISLSRTGLFALKESTVRFDGDFKGLSPYTIGITAGFSYGEAFDSSGLLNKDPSTETEAVVVKVLLGRNELGAGNMAVIKSIAKKRNALERIRFLTPLLHSQKLYVGFSRAGKYGGLAEAFSAALLQFKGTDAYGAILKKYNME